MEPRGRPSFSRPQEIPDQPSSDGGAATSRAPSALSCLHPVLSQRGPGGGSGRTPSQGRTALCHASSEDGARLGGRHKGHSKSGRGLGSAGRRPQTRGNFGKRPSVGGSAPSGDTPAPEDANLVSTPTSSSTRYTSSSQCCGTHERGDTFILHHAFISIFIALWAVITHFISILMATVSYFTRFTMKRGNAGSWNSGWKRSKHWKPILHCPKIPKTPRNLFLELIRIIERKKYLRGPTPWPGGWGRAL